MPAVLASCAVPGLLPPVEIDGEHYFDGGLVHSIPVGRAVALGASTVYVLQVGRIESELTVPRRPWEVGLVAFEIARRHRFHEEMSAVARRRPRARPARGRQTGARLIFRSSGTATRLRSRRVSSVRTGVRELSRRAGRTLIPATEDQERGCSHPG